MTSDKSVWQHTLPVDLKAIIGDVDWEADELGCSGTHIYHIGSCYLKIAPYTRIPYQEWSTLEAEMERLRWLAGRLPVPEVRYYGYNAHHEFLLISALDGMVSCDRALSERVPEVVRLLARGLHMIHEVDIAHCPFDLRAESQLALGRQYVEHGLIDKTNFNAEFQGMEAEEVYALAQHLRPEREDLVFTHGDYCLPNILVDTQLACVNGFIDWGRGGIADRYTDLALAARSLALNFGAQWIPLLFEEYGLPKPDQDRLRFYRALDEITFCASPTVESESHV